MNFHNAVAQKAKILFAAPCVTANKSEVTTYDAI